MDEQLHLWTIKQYKHTSNLRVLLEQRQRIIQAFEDVDDDYLTEWTDQRQEVSFYDTWEREGSRRDHEEEQIMFE